MVHTKEWYANWTKPKIKEGKPTKYGWTVLHKEGLELEPWTDIGAGCIIQAEAGVRIEMDVEIGGNVCIYSVSTIDDKRGPVVLQRGCKIGAGSVILPGVTVGQDTVVGALSLVNKDLPAGVVAYGIPARVKK